MRKIWILAAMLLCGCAVEAEDDIDTYTGTVIENDGETALVQLERTAADETDSETAESQQQTEEDCPQWRFHRRDEMLILDENSTVGFDELKKDDQVVVSFSKHKAVIRLIEDEDSAE